MNSYRVSPQSLILIPKSLVNFAYRKFVKGFPCCACGINWWIEFCHTGPTGKGQKATDLDGIPLCKKCHILYHDIGRAKFEVVKFLCIFTIILELQQKAIAQGIDLKRDDTPRKRMGKAGGLKKYHRGIA